MEVAFFVTNSAKLRIRIDGISYPKVTERTFFEVSVYDVIATNAYCNIRRSKASAAFRRTNPWFIGNLDDLACYTSSYWGAGISTQIKAPVKSLRISVEIAVSLDICVLCSSIPLYPF